MGFRRKSERKKIKKGNNAKSTKKTSYTQYEKQKKDNRRVPGLVEHDIVNVDCSSCMVMTHAVGFFFQVCE